MSVPKRPTILQIIPSLDSGGAERTVVEITDAVVRGRGRALVASEGGRLVADVEKAGGTHINFPAATKNPLQIIANGRALERLIASERVSLIHARSRAPAWSALLAARRSKIAFVTTYHGAYSEKGRVKNLYNGVMARADRVIAASDYTANLIRTRYGAPDSKIAIIPRGIDPAQFDPSVISPERLDVLRTAWGITPATLVILHAARLSPPKGQTTVIDAAGRLGLAFEQAHGPVAIILAGSAQGRDAYERDLDQRIAAHHLGAVVKRVGHVSDMAAAYALAHVAVLPSRTPEGFGRASIEAQAMGVPVIAARIGAQPETVLAFGDAPAGTETGWIVAPADADALAGALAEALALSATARTSMATRARNHAITRYTLQALQSRTLDVYDQLLGTSLAGVLAKANPS